MVAAATVRNVPSAVITHYPYKFGTKSQRNCGRVEGKSRSFLNKAGRSRLLYSRKLETARAGRDLLDNY